MDIANRIRLINIAKSHLDMVHDELEAARQIYEKLDLLLENACEIGQIAALLEKEEKIIIDDGKELSMFCVSLAKEFEEKFDPENGDYWLDIDEFALDALINEFGKPTAPSPMRDNDAFYKDYHSICYVPENAESNKDQYSRSRLLALVHGDESLCTQLFETLEWQFPETLIDENVRDGLWGKCEACGRYHDTEDKEMTECPHCHSVLKGE